MNLTKSTLICSLVLLFLFALLSTAAEEKKLRQKRSWFGLGSSLKKKCRKAQERGPYYKGGKYNARCGLGGQGGQYDQGINQFGGAPYGGGYNQPFGGGGNLQQLGGGYNQQYGGGGKTQQFGGGYNPPRYGGAHGGFGSQGHGGQGYNGGQGSAGNPQVGTVGQTQGGDGTSHGGYTDQQGYDLE